MKKLLGMLLCLLLCMGCACAQEDVLEYGRFFYRLNADGTAAVLDYTGEEKDIRIPQELDGYPVTEIAENAFRESEVRSVEIPEGVLVIGNSAFVGCSLLESVTLPQTLRKIGGFAFSQSGLQSVVIPEGVVMIDDEAFDYCTALRYAVLPESLGYLGFMTFNNHGDYPSAVKIAPEGSYADLFHAVGMSSTFLKSGDFCYTLNEDATATIVKCMASGKVAVPETLDGYRVTAIGDAAFVFAADMVTLQLPDSVERIGVCAFRGLDRLTSVHLPENLEEIGHEAFAYCQSLSGVQWPQKLKRIGTAAFAECGSLQNVQLPASVEEIGDCAFAGSGISEEEALAHASVLIGQHAFAADDDFYEWHIQDDSLQKYWLSKEQRIYRDSGFLYTRGDDQCVTIERYAAEDEECNRETIEIPQELDGFPVTAVGDYAFCGVEAEEIIVPQGVKTIGRHAFSDTYARISLPAALEHIDEFAFCNNQYHYDVLILPEGVKHILCGAFMAVSADEVILPEALESIEAFGLYTMEEDMVNIDRSRVTVDPFAFGNMFNWI